MNEAIPKHFRCIVEWSTSVNVLKSLGTRVLDGKEEKYKCRMGRGMKKPRGNG